MTSAFLSLATTLLTLLPGNGAPANTSTTSADPAGARVVPTIDVRAPQLFGADGVARRGGQAARIELDDAKLNAATSAWYRLAYIDGGTRLQVFEHSTVTTTGPQSDAIQSETIAWHLANQALGLHSQQATQAPPPNWAHIRTGNQTGFSAGLIFTLAYIDLLTPGQLVGNLRIAGTGGVGPDGVVTPAFGIDVKVAAALLTRPDVIFTTSAPDSIDHVTIIEFHHTRNPDPGYTVAEWLNLNQYRQAGQDAASHQGTLAVVEVHDLRQALAYLCGRTHNTTTCATASRAATIPIGTA
jgi:hypothetical protein